MKPEVNAEIAGAYLKYQTDRYGGDKIKTIASYNAGRYNESKIVPGKPRNLKYVKRVLKTMRELERHEKL
jgi:soluble lytic murein transglycosylase-like protein